MYNYLGEQFSVLYHKEDVEMTDEIISLYDLLNAINIFLKYVETILDKHELVEEINQKNAISLFRKQFIYIFNNKKKHQLIPSKVEYIFPETLIDDGFSTIYVGTSEGVCGERNFLAICKDINDDRIFFKYPITRVSDQYFVKNNIQYFMQLFKTLEEFQKRFNASIVSGIVAGMNTMQVLYSDIFKISIDVSNKEKMYDINLIDEKMNEQFQKMEEGYLCYKNLLYIEKESYFRKIGISINDLNDFFKQVIKFSYDKEKVKVLKI